MVFQNKNLSVLAYANNFTLWHYSTQDTLDDIMSETYFMPVKTLMNTGDVIIINCADGAAYRYVKEIKDGIVLAHTL